MCVGACRHVFALALLVMARSPVFLQILPATDNILPSTVLIFQLLNLPGPGDHVSAGVAWGAFPVCGANLRHIHGRWAECRV